MATRYPEPDRWVVPVLRREWLVAAVVGAGLALVLVLAVAFVESSRFPSAPTAEEGAHEWGTLRSLGDNTDDSEKEAKLGEEEYGMRDDESAIDVKITHSGTLSGGSGTISDVEPQ